VSVNSKVNLF